MLGGSGGRCPTDVFMLRVGGMPVVEVWWGGGGGGIEGPNKLRVLSLFKMGEKRFPPPFCFADLDTILLNGLKQDSAQSKEDL